MIMHQDETGLRKKMLEIVKGRGESLVTNLLGNTSYATLRDVLKAKVPPEMTDLDSIHWWETGVL